MGTTKRVTVIFVVLALIFCQYYFLYTANLTNTTTATTTTNSALIQTSNSRNVSMLFQQQNTIYINGTMYQPIVFNDALLYLPDNVTGLSFSFWANPTKIMKKLRGIELSFNKQFRCSVRTSRGEKFRFMEGNTLYCNICGFRMFSDNITHIFYQFTNTVLTINATNNSLSLYVNGELQKKYYSKNINIECLNNMKYNNLTILYGRWIIGYVGYMADITIWDGIIDEKQIYNIFEENNCNKIYNGSYYKHYDRLDKYFLYPHQYDTYLYLNKFTQITLNNSQISMSNYNDFTINFWFILKDQLLTANFVFHQVTFIGYIGDEIGYLVYIDGKRYQNRKSLYIAAQNTTHWYDNMDKIFGAAYDMLYKFDFIVMKTKYAKNIVIGEKYELIICDLSIWNRSLNEIEINNLFHGQYMTELNHKELLKYYPLSRNQITTISEKKDNNKYQILNAANDIISNRSSLLFNGTLSVHPWKFELWKNLSTSIVYQCKDLPRDHSHSHTLIANSSNNYFVYINVTEILHNDQQKKKIAVVFEMETNIAQKYHYNYTIYFMAENNLNHSIANIEGHNVTNYIEVTVDVNVQKNRIRRTKYGFNSQNRLHDINKRWLGLSDRGDLKTVKWNGMWYNSQTKNCGTAMSDQMVGYEACTAFTGFQIGLIGMKTTEVGVWQYCLI